MSGVCTQTPGPSDQGHHHYFGKERGHWQATSGGFPDLVLGTPAVAIPKEKTPQELRAKAMLFFFFLNLFKKALMAGI